jgi:predicted small secreted protein
MEVLVMKTLLVLILPFILAGCQTVMGYQQMTAEQIKATAGTISCVTIDTLLYGKGSVIAINTDDTKRGATSRWKTSIKCGDAEMTIDAMVGTQ